MLYEFRPHDRRRAGRLLPDAIRKTKRRSDLSAGLAFFIDIFMEFRYNSDGLNSDGRVSHLSWASGGSQSCAEEDAQVRRAARARSEIAIGEAGRGERYERISSEQ